MCVNNDFSSIDKENTVALDVGCGTGRWAEYILPKVKKWKTTLCYKAIERILETEELCKLNSKIAKIICWRTLRNIASIKYS